MESGHALRASHVSRTSRASSRYTGTEDPDVDFDSGRDEMESVVPPSEDGNEALPHSHSGTGLHGDASMAERDGESLRMSRDSRLDKEGSSAAFQNVRRSVDSHPSRPPSSMTPSEAGWSEQPQPLRQQQRQQHQPPAAQHGGERHRTNSWDWEDDRSPDAGGHSVEPSPRVPARRPSSSSPHKRDHHRRPSRAADGGRGVGEGQQQDRKQGRRGVSRSIDDGAAASSRVEQGSKPKSPAKRRPGAFEGDVSAWGRTQVEGFYEDDQSMASQPTTLSSGLSPRDAEARAQAPFDIDAARAALAYQSGMYSRAQAMRRDGSAPAAAGVADDLPTRMAYQQLNILAGMAGKVQDAILHNKRIFEHRLLMDDRAILKRVLDGWRAARYGSVAKQQVLQRAVARIAHGSLQRAFTSWREKFHLVDKNLAMKRKVAVAIARGLMRRTFAEWRRLVEERWWKNQCAMREREVQHLDAYIRNSQRRPVLVLARRRMRGVFKAWFAAAGERRSRRLRMQKAVHHLMQQQYAKAWNSWLEFHETVARRRVLMAKTLGRLANLKLAHAWESWMEVLEAQRAQESKISRAVALWTRAARAKAWNSWVAMVEWRKEKKAIMQRWKQPHKARAFAAWYEQTQWRRRMRVIVSRSLGKMRNRQLGDAFQSWVEAWGGTKLQARLSSKEGAEETLQQLAAENERLRRDNERFVRLIDSGEWGRGRVAELVSAGEVLQGERDALLKLIGSLRREYEAVQAAKNSQEEELRSIKERAAIGGPARNRMLIKGGSSFNALVRAMKQDMIDNGAAARDPTLAYEIDRLSMERVQVYPDGELNVQAVASGAGGGGPSTFARPGTAAGEAAATAPAGMPRVRVGAGSHAAAGRLGTGSSAGTPLAGASASGKLHGSGTLMGLGTGAAVAALGPRSKHTTSTFTASPAAGATVEAAAPAPASPAATQRILEALQSLSPAEVDRLESAVRQDRGAGVGAATVQPSGARRV